MADDKTPDQYLAELQEQADRQKHEPAAGFDPAPVLQPGQTLRQVLTEEEINGLRAFTYRTGGSEAVLEFERELDVPYDPNIDDLIAQEEALRAQMAMKPLAEHRKPTKANTVVGVLLGLGIVLGVIAAGVAFLPSESDDERVTSLAQAEGALKERGEEAVAAMEKLSVPETWKQRDEPEISMDGYEGSSYAFYNVSWTVPKSYTVDEFETWFKEQPEVAARPEEAKCEANVAREEATCEVEFYRRGVDGERDYDAARQTVTFNFYSGSPTEENAVFAEAYSSD